jgi:hypothetical protein
MTITHKLWSYNRANGVVNVTFGYKIDNSNALFNYGYYYSSIDKTTDTLAKTVEGVTFTNFTWLPGEYMYEISLKVYLLFYRILVWNVNANDLLLWWDNDVMAIDDIVVTMYDTLSVPPIEFSTTEESYYVMPTTGTSGDLTVNG